MIRLSPLETGRKVLEFRFLILNNHVTLHSRTPIFRFFRVVWSELSDEHPTKIFPRFYKFSVLSRIAAIGNYIDHLGVMTFLAPCNIVLHNIFSIFLSFLMRFIFSNINVSKFLFEISCIIEFPKYYWYEIWRNYWRHIDLFGLKNISQ